MHENGMGKHSGHSGHIPESLPTTRFMLLWHIGTPARSNWLAWAGEGPCIWFLFQTGHPNWSKWTKWVQIGLQIATVFDMPGECMIRHPKRFQVQSSFRWFLGVLGERLKHLGQESSKQMKQTIPNCNNSRKPALGTPINIGPGIPHDFQGTV